MTQFSKASWHYRLYRYIRSVPDGPQFINPWHRGVRPDYKTPEGLCPYVWSLVLGTIGVVALFVFLIAAAIPIMIAYGLYLLYLALKDVKVNVNFGLSKPERKPSPPSEKKGLFAAYMKARKDKVCPRIEWVD